MIANFLNENYFYNRMNKTAIFTAIFIGLSLGQADLFGQAVANTPATIMLTNGARPQGVIKGSNAQGIMFATGSAQQAKLIPYSQIKGEGIEKLIRIGVRGEALGNARALFVAGKYRDAAVEFGKVSDAYAILLAIPQNFAVEARFFQIESLRRAGAFPEIGPLLETPAGKAIPTLLGKSYQRPHVFHKLWALYGEQKMDELKKALEVYQLPVTGAAKLLREPNFQRDLPTSELVQIAFLRAKLYAAANEKQKALDDYYRVFTLTYGNDSFLAKQAMGAAMVIQKDALGENPDKMALHQMQSIAFLFSKNYGAMPASFKEFAVRPDLPRIVAPKKKEEKKAEEKPKAAEPKKAGKKSEGEAGDKKKPGEKKK